MFFLKALVKTLTFIFYILYNIQYTEDNILESLEYSFPFLFNLKISKTP